MTGWTVIAKRERECVKEKEITVCVREKEGKERSEESWPVCSRSSAAYYKTIINIANSPKPYRRHCIGGHVYIISDIYVCVHKIHF